MRWFNKLTFKSLGVLELLKCGTHGATYMGDSVSWNILKIELPGKQLAHAPLMPA